MSTGIRIIFFLCLVARLVEGNKCSLAEPFRLAPAKGNCPGKVGCWCSNGQCTQCAGSGLNGGHGVYCPGDQRQHLCPPNQWIPFSGCDCGSSGGGDPNQGHCYDCPAGQQPTSDQSGCQSCSFPLYNPTSGGTCGPCPANQYWTSPSSCTPCPAGTSGGGGNVSSCVPCQYPLYNPTAGGECVACPASTCWQSAISCGPCSVNASCSPQIYSKQYDYVVVGTGPAAGPIIRRLADAGYSVLVLEQGPYFYQQDQGNPASKPNTDKQPQFDDEFQVKESVWQFPSTTVSCPTTERGLWKRASVHEDSLATALGVRSDLFTRSLRMGDFNDDKDTMDETSGRKFRRKRRYPYAQVQGFGGNTLTYGGLHLRPSPDAFATWPDGFSFDEMLPWYMKMEQFSFACSANNTGFPDPNLAHNCKAPQGYIHVNLQREDEYPALVASVPQYCAGGKERHEWLNTCGSADAVDYNGAYPVRAFCGPPQFSGTVQEDPKGNPVTLTRDTLQKTYLPASYITNSSLVTVCLSTTVRRLILDNNNTIVGAQLAGTEKVVTGRRFILISGVRHTPEILMSSGIGSSEELSKFNVPTYIDLPAVGKFFHDEWAYALSFTVSDNANNYWIPSESSIVNRNQLHLVKFVSSIQTRNFTDVQLYLRLENKLSLDDYLPPEDFGGSTYGDSFTVRVALFQIDTFGNRSGVHAVASNGVYVDRFNFSIDMFQSENLLQRFMCGAWEGFNETCHLLEALTNQVDPSGKSLVLTPSEPTRKLIAAAQAGVEEFEKVLSNEAMVLALHGGGTCRMGDCVDTTFKVIGTQNLFVCDMSIFPNPVDANPTATLFALGERLAAQLIQEPPSILH